MPKPPLPPEKKDELARELRSKLRNQRPRYALRLILAAALVIGVLTLVWLGSRTTRDWPQLLLVGHDEVTQVGEPCEVRARLEAVDDPTGSLADLEIFWRLPEGESEDSLSKTDARGSATFKLPAFEREAIRAISLHHIDPVKRYRRDDTARVFVVDADRLLTLVPIEGGLIAEKRVDWGRGGAEFPEIRPGAIRDIVELKSQPVYLVNAPRVWDYRGARGWLQSQIAQGLPDGPLLVNDGDAAKTALRKRFGLERAVVWEAK